MNCFSVWSCVVFVASLCRVSAFALSTPSTGMVSVGAGYTLALKSDGTVWTWGRGPLGDGVTTQRYAPAQVSGLNSVVAISAGSAPLVLKSDGSVWSWTYNTTPAQIGGLSNVVSIASANDFALVAKSDGTVWAWGTNSSGQLGDGTYTPRTSPIQVIGLTSVIAVSAGSHFSLALKADGMVWAWGSNSSGVLGDGTTVTRTQPAQVVGLSNATAICAGSSFSMALKADGTVWTWGNNTTGQLGDGSTDGRVLAAQVSNLGGIVGIAAGYSHAIALTDVGSVYGWGQIGMGWDADHASADWSYKTPQHLHTVSEITTVAAGNGRTMLSKSDGTVIGWGDSSGGGKGDGTDGYSLPQQTSKFKDVISVAAGQEYSAIARSDGTVWMWGFHTLGDGTELQIEPMQVSELSGVQSVVAGYWGYTVVLKTDGTVWSWGTNNNGQLGNGTTTAPGVPVQASGLTGITTIAAGYQHTIALKNDGTVWAWGRNTGGQLGDGTTVRKTVPTQVLGLTEVVSICAAFDSNYALKADGTVWAWGRNTYGQIGDGTYTNRLSPVQVTGVSGVVQLVAGANHVMALGNTGTMWAWGFNIHGQVGDGTLSNRNTPVVLSAANVSKIFATVYGSYIRKTDGSVWAWGANNSGELGDGQYAIFNQNTPVRVMRINAPDQISGSDYHSLALLPDGRLYSWGYLFGSGGEGRWPEDLSQAAIRLLSDLADSNANGVSDVWEMTHYGDLLHSVVGDTDSDGLTDIVEYFIGSNPLSADVDGDGLDDVVDPAPLDFYNGEEPTLLIVGGNNQSALPGESNSQPFEIAAWKGDATQPLSGAPVTFTVTTGSGMLSDLFQSGILQGSSISLLTNGEGRAKANYQHSSTSGENIITVSAGTAQVQFYATTLVGSGPVDSDLNGLPDAWEIEFFGRIGVSPSGDADNDGFSNLMEFQNETAPDLPDITSTGDTDLDNLPDAWELHYFGTMAYGSQSYLPDVGLTMADAFTQNIKPYQEPEVRAGLRAWYKISQGVSDGGSILAHLWADSSGHAFHLAQTLNAQKPLFVYPSEYASNREMLFDGGQSMATGLSGMLDGENDFTVFVVLKPLPEQSAGATVLSLDGSLAVRHKAADSNEYVLSWTRTSDQQIQGDEISLTATTDGLQLLTFLKAGPAQSGFLNGDLAASGPVDAALPPASAPFVLGSSSEGANNGFSGNIVEVLTYNRALTPAERAQVESDLITKYRLDDLNGNGLPDRWERLHFGAIGVNPDGDPDDDGVSNREEFTLGTDPHVHNDADGNGLDDVWEVTNFGQTGVDPDADADGDGLTNRQENSSGSNPNNADSDGDGMTDRQEKEHGTDLNDPGSGVFDLVNWGSWVTETGTTPVEIIPASGVRGFFSWLGFDNYIRYQKVYIIGSRGEVSEFSMEYTIRDGRWYRVYINYAGRYEGYNDEVDYYMHYGHYAALADSDAHSGDGVGHSQEITLSEPVPPAFAGGEPYTFTYWLTGIPSAGRDDDYAEESQYTITVPSGVLGILRWNEIFTPADTTQPQVITPREWLIDGQTGPTYTLSPSQNGSLVAEIDEEASELIYVDARLLTDANRDSVIQEFNGTDATSEDSPYRFWVNDDDDHPESFGSIDDADQIPVQQPDWSNHIIDCERDLEDFSRLQLYIAGAVEGFKGTPENPPDLYLGLKWTEISSGTPAIKIYRHLEVGGGLNYLTNPAVSRQEYAERGANSLPLGDISGLHGDYLVEGSAVYVLSPSLLADLSSTKARLNFLFEGCKSGIGQLQLVILKRGEVGFIEIGLAGGAWLDIKSVKSMYEGPGTSFVQPIDEAPHGIVFVHGWNMSPEGSVSFAETMFKRLWHRGFKGRFVSLRWNTNYSDAFDNVPLIGAAVEGYLADYNGSEHVAWQSGVIVKAAVDGLPSGYSRNIVAHSMGNIIAGSALLAGVSFDNYVLMQAAVPASCYDERALLQQAEASSPQTYVGFHRTFWEADTSPDNDPISETRGLSYRGRLSASIGNMINFYLPDDVATTYAWEFNNDFTKPTVDYGYTRNSPAIAGSQTGIWKLRFPGGPSDQVDYLNDPYEAMPFVCRSWSKVVGADSRTAGVIQGNLDLSSETFSPPGGTGGFRDEHSAQFKRRIQVLRPFYDELLRQLRMDPTP